MLINAQSEDLQRQKLPLIPLRGIVIFPNMMIPLIIGRESSINAVTYAYENKLPLFLSAQKDKEKEDPQGEDIFSIGCVANIIEVAHLTNGMVRILVEGLHRAEVLRYISGSDFFFVEVEERPTYSPNEAELEALIRSLKEKFTEYITMSPKIPQEAIATVMAVDDPDKLVDGVMAYLPAQLGEKQEILQEDNINEQMTKALSLVAAELEVLRIEDNINKRVQDRMEKMQKKYFLNEQLKEIRRELDEDEEVDETLGEFEQKAKELDMPDEVREKFENELKRLSNIPSMSPEYTVLHTYLEWLVELPWGVFSEDNRELKIAEEILAAEHYGLEEPKERILDFIAVRQLSLEAKGPIICLVGPPGTGKTSLSRSVAHALNRKFVRFSLGGVRDEAEIRGHRRTYVGAMPGKIVQLMKKAGTQNPVILLDEIDKMSTDFRGDPSSALLEVLDPEQNISFQDHYLGVDIDLSKVLFMTTANNLYQIPAPLRDRMDVIEVPGYTEIEKKEIAKQFLIKKQIEENGLSSEDVQFTDKAILDIVRYYTKEAGVRNLERNLGKVVRKVARKKLEKNVSTVKIEPRHLQSYLGVKRFDYNKAFDEPRVGVIAGLAWTENGGDVLYIECSIFPGKGDLILTGKLGEVMQESARIAYSYAKEIAGKYGIDSKTFSENDMHIHLPEGAIPKDGPSAGVTLVSAIISTLSGRKVRNNFAMTGEVTLKGDVLPIGGLREKLLAAKRGGIFEVIIPKRNEKDVKEISSKILERLHIHYVEKAEEVLEKILLS